MISEVHAEIGTVQEPSFFFNAAVTRVNSEKGMSKGAVVTEAQRPDTLNAVHACSNNTSNEVHRDRQPFRYREADSAREKL